MKLCLTLFLVSVLAFVSSEKNRETQLNSCVCDCDPDNDSQTTKWTKKPVTKHATITAPTTTTTTTTTTSDPTSGPCRCLKKHEGVRYFCGSRKTELVGRCNPNTLYSCGKKMKLKNANLSRECRVCVELHTSENDYGKDHCKSGMGMNSITNQTL